MLYLIRFEVRQTDGISLSELREIWRRELVAREPRGSGFVQSFKTMGRRTIFVIADFPDDEALDGALAALPIVEELGSAVEIELIPAWPFDDPGVPGQTLTHPVEEPAQPDVPGRASTEPEDSIRSEQTGEEPERTPAELASEPPVAAEALSDRESPRETPPPSREEPPAAESGQPEDVSATGLVRSPDAPGLAPAGQDTPQEPAAAEPEPPEETSVTGLIQIVDAPGQAPAEPAARAGAGQQEEPSEEVAGQPEETSVTSVLRSLDKPEQEAAVKSGALLDFRVSLQVQSGSASGEVFEVVGRVGATIGRSPDNSIQISGDSKISRRHVRIEFRDGDYWLTDLGSSYGTFVNQARLSAPHQLRSGDVIELGATRLGVTLEAEPTG